MKVMVRTWHVTVHDGIDIHLALIEQLTIVEPSVAHHDENGNYAGYSGGDFIHTMMVTDDDVCTDGVHSRVTRGEAWGFQPSECDILMREFVLDLLGYDETDTELYEDVWSEMEFEYVDNGADGGCELFEVAA